MLFGMAIGEFHLSVLIGFRQAPTKQMLEKRIRQAVDIFMLAAARPKCPCRHLSTNAP